ncbi:hypothetical protein PR202_ga22739 [Eleusine coracana subsp. coracana]|uniref:Glutathione S-transferase n=1 Tax=Eleusine coracana subsp. coracana TaxID=191504 RepID=A0AAV5D4E2_ELECO|nr:hypothetical protein QOZ80_9AG0692550 [Eleusine coracana subsp. coracana]GJN05134.1 hypothetical protein PR202_ga22739 [Eleusine coracana subsp. coracana]
MAGNDADVKLLGSPVSPFAIRARMALKLKGVSYEYLEQDLFNKSRLLRSSNPVHMKILPDWLGIMKAMTVEARLEMVQQSNAKMKLLEDALAIWPSNSKDLFGGHSVGYLDLALGSFLFWFKTLHNIIGVDIISVSNTPLMSTWAGRFMETTIAKEVEPEESRMEEHVRKAYYRNLSSL